MSDTQGSGISGVVFETRKKEAPDEEEQQERSPETESPHPSDGSDRKRCFCRPFFLIIVALLLACLLIAVITVAIVLSGRGGTEISLPLNATAAHATEAPTTDAPTPIPNEDLYPTCPFDECFPEGEVCSDEGCCSSCCCNKQGCSYSGYYDGVFVYQILSCK